MKRALALGAIAVLAIGAGGAYALTRPSADIDIGGGYGTRAWGGMQVVEEPEYGPASRFKGTGKFAAIRDGDNATDHPVPLTVPRGLGNRGLNVSVVFVPRTRDNYAPVIESDEELERATTTIPPRAGGSIIHVFHVTDCRRAGDVEFAKLPLETDGHPARVEIAPTTDSRELARYEDEALEPEDRLRYEGC